MFPGSTAGGFASGPTTGAVSANPADSIPADGLSIQQVAQLEAQLETEREEFAAKEAAEFARSDWFEAPEASGGSEGGTRR